MQTPNYIKSLLMPNGKKPAGKRAWGIDLETVWLPFFTSTNVMGDTDIPLEAIGAPIRLAYASDGSIKFNKSGRPVTKVAKELAEAVILVRENFTANLQSYAGSVIANKADDYRDIIARAKTAGEPLLNHDRQELDKAMAQAVEEAMSKAEPAPAPAPEPEAKTKGDTKELVTA